MVPTPMGLVVVGLQMSKGYTGFYLLTPADTLRELARVSWFTGNARKCLTPPFEYPNYCPSVYNPIDTAIYMPIISCNTASRINYDNSTRLYKEVPLYCRIHLGSDLRHDFAGKADTAYYIRKRFISYRYQWHSVSAPNGWATGFEGTYHIHLAQPNGSIKVFGEPGEHALEYFAPQPLRWRWFPPLGLKRRNIPFRLAERRLNHWSNTYGAVLYDSTRNQILREYSAFPDTVTSTRQHYLQVYNAADLSYVREIPLGPRVYQLFWAQGALMLIRAPEDDEGTVASVEQVEY
jgi:hypothetical protein